MDTTFPFIVLDNIELNKLFRANTNEGPVPDLNIVDVNPLNYQYDKYNEYDVDHFYGNVRSINIPNSEVIFSPNPISYDSLFTILAMNIVSVVSYLQSVEDQIISLSNINYDVITFSETRVHSDISNLYNIPEYAMHSKTS